MSKIRKNKIILSNGKEVSFTGEYLGDTHPITRKKTKNWHYYLDVKGRVYHFRKEHFICCIEQLSNEDKKRLKK